MYEPLLYQTFWALLPPVIAILAALITKEVYCSLFLGISIGGIIFGIGQVDGHVTFQLEKTISFLFKDCLLGVLSDTYNIGIILFLVILGILVSLMNKAGGSAAFGKWISKYIKTAKGTLIATVFLGIMIFIDDYFNCLTVGNVMRPATDNKKISRAKLAYIIDSTAAPICIIMPISSWAAAVSGFVNSDKGFTTFIKAIPYNYYALFTIVTLFTIILLKVDFGPMKHYEANAAKEVSFSTKEFNNQDTNENISNPRGTIIDFFFTIACIIICCVIGMIYTGGFFLGKDIISAFANSDASVGLMLGGFFALLITSIFYSIRKVMTYKDISQSIPDGLTSMVPSILILVFAWTLKTITDGLGLSGFVSAIVVSLSENIVNILPALIFIIAALLAFATGTSWGIFGILIPIIVSAFGSQNETFLIISISACLAGAVCGDHCSPISDTTIMASAGAKCDHLQHVSSQLPYVIVVAIISSLAYIIVGYIQNPILPLLFGCAAIIGTFLGIKRITNQKNSV